MVTDQVWGDLWSVCHAIGVKVLLVGDRFQLAPVKPDDKAFSCLTSLKTNYRTDLTEVVRQALDNPIIRASMMIREGEEEAMDAIGLLPSTPAKALIPQFLALDPNRALIAWRNETRGRLNAACRTALNQPEEDIAVGEPLLVMYNNYILDRFNGEVVEFAGWEMDPRHQIAVRNAPKNLSIFARYGLARIKDIIQPALMSPEEVFSQVLDMPPKTMAFYSRVYAHDVFGYERKQEPSHLSANFGYCLTAHKAQGSEWNDVMVVIEPGMKWLETEGRRWLYTAITRARQNVRICFY
jgi:exodeoxyribonuclease-5